MTTSSQINPPIKIPAARGRKLNSGRMVELLKSLRKDEPQIVKRTDLIACYDGAVGLGFKVQTSIRSIPGFITLKPGEALVWRLFESETAATPTGK